MSDMPEVLDTALAHIPVAISTRHAHLTQATIEQLFGRGHELRVRAPLRQPGQFAAQETVTLVGPRGRIPHVAIVGPPRADDQVEVSRTDEFTLGLDAPLRESGDLAHTPGLIIEGPAGQVALDHGVICALRHIHMSPADADALGLENGERVEVLVGGKDRRLTFGDVLVRVSPDYRLELHLDTDEGNAAGLHPGEDGLLLSPTQGTAALQPNRAEGHSR